MPTLAANALDSVLMLFEERTYKFLTLHHALMQSTVTAPRKSRIGCV